MFENIYGLSCVENQVLAQLKLYGMDISVLYGTSSVGFEELFYQMVVKAEKPEHTAIVPRIQDVLKKLGVISLELIKSDILNFQFGNSNKYLVRVKPVFVKQKLYARGLRTDHYVLVEKNGNGYTLYNDIPETVVSLSESEFESVYDGEYFVLTILRDLSKNDSRSINSRIESLYNNDVSFLLRIKDIEQIENIGVRIRNFFWIYKILLYRFTENYISFLEVDVVEGKRNLVDNMFARAEYFNLKKTTDVLVYINLINEAFENHMELLWLLKTGVTSMNERIKNIIEDVSPAGGKINEKSKLKDDLGIDSLRLVELLLALENEFDIEFALSDLDVKKFSVVVDVYSLVEKYVR